MVRRTLYTAVGVIATLALFVAPAAATSEPVTKMTLMLGASSVPAGSNVSGSVLVMSGPGKKAEPFAGAALTVSIDGVDVGSTSTHGSGVALVSVPATTVGLHVMRVAFPGDALHKKAHDEATSAVTAAAPTATTTPPPDPTTTAPPDPTTTAPPDPTTTAPPDPTTIAPPDPTAKSPPDPTTTTPPPPRPVPDSRHNVATQAPPTAATC